MCVRLLSEFFSFPTQSNHMQVRVTERRRCGSTFVELGDKLKLTRPPVVVVRRRLRDVSVMLDDVMTLKCRAVVNKDPCESVCEVNVL